MCGLSANIVNLRTEVLRDQGKRYLVPEGRYFRRFRRSAGGGGVGACLVVCTCAGFEFDGGLLPEEGGVGRWEVESRSVLVLLLLAAAVVVVVVLVEEVPGLVVGAVGAVTGAVVVAVGGEVVFEATTVATGCRMG